MKFSLVIKVYNWEGSFQANDHKYLGLILFGGAASLAVLLFLIFHPQIEAVNKESPILINIMFIPAMAVGFLYGVRITERAVKPSEIRSPIKRSIVKIFLFFFVIGGMFSSVNFAINGGSIMPGVTILEDGLIMGKFFCCSKWRCYISNHYKYYVNGSSHKKNCWDEFRNFR